jgi:hypothetical protein
VVRSFPHSRLITGFEVRLTRRLPLVEPELLTLPEHLSLPLVLMVFCVAKSFVCWPRHNHQPRLSCMTNVSLGRSANLIAVFTSNLIIIYLTYAIVN